MTVDHVPQLNERFRCEKCGMEIQITKACPCTDKCPEFRCCGADLVACDKKGKAELTPEAQQNVYTA